MSIRVNPQKPSETMASKSFNRFTDPHQNGAQISKGFEMVGVIAIVLGLMGFML